MQFRYTKLITIPTLLVTLFTFANCKDEEDSSTSDLLTLLALASLQQTDGSLLTTEQFQGAATASAVTAAASSAAATATAMNTPNPVMLMASIIENGRDPVYARKAVRRYQAELRVAERGPARVQPAAIMSTRTGGSACTGSGATYACDGTYTLSGTADGIGVETGTLDAGQYSPYLGGQSCLITQKVPSGTRGLMTVGSGSEMTWSVSAGAGSYTSNMNLNFNDFGTLWFDYYTYMRVLKDIQDSGQTSTLSPFGQTCADVQGYYELFNRIYNDTVLTGDVQSTSTNTYIT